MRPLCFFFTLFRCCFGWACREARPGARSSADGRSRAPAVATRRRTPSWLSSATAWCRPFGFGAFSAALAPARVRRGLRLR